MMIVIVVVIVVVVMMMVKMKATWHALPCVTNPVIKVAVMVVIVVAAVVMVAAAAASSLLARSAVTTLCVSWLGMLLQLRGPSGGHQLGVMAAFLKYQGPFDKPVPGRGVGVVCYFNPHACSLSSGMLLLAPLWD